MEREIINPAGTSDWGELDECSLCDAAWEVIIDGIRQAREENR